MVKHLPASAGNGGLIPVSGRSPGEGNGNPLQYSCLGNCMDRGAWGYNLWGHNGVRHDLCDQRKICSIFSDACQCHLKSFLLFCFLFFFFTSMSFFPVSAAVFSSTLWISETTEICHSQSRFKHLHMPSDWGLC